MVSSPKSKGGGVWFLIYHTQWVIVSMITLISNIVQCRTLHLIKPCHWFRRWGRVHYGQNGHFKCFSIVASLSWRFLLARFQVFKFILCGQMLANGLLNFMFIIWDVLFFPSLGAAANVKFNGENSLCFDFYRFCDKTPDVWWSIFLKCMLLIYLKCLIHEKVNML